MGGFSDYSLHKPISQHEILCLISCTYEHKGLERLCVPLNIHITALAL